MKDMDKKMGISSKCSDGSHILMMDFDLSEGECRKKLLCELIARGSIVSGFNDMPDMYIFSTQHGFHIVCFAKMPLGILLDRYKEFNDLADKKHMEIGGSVCKRFILRFGEDIHLAYIIRGYNEKPYKTSNAHIKFFEAYYNIKIREQNRDQSGVCLFERWTVWQNEKIK